jgi:formylglycine-generating enzyme required for sulfatase activity
MLLVPAGSFTMGADEGGEQDEHPAHQVTLRAFWLDETEVTNEAYEACVTAKACRAAMMSRVGGPKKPVRYVSWADAKAYCAHNGGKRLPREAEFERAIRGDDGRRFPWGNELAKETQAVFGRMEPMDVGSKPAGKGPYGHHDLAGNVWEWMDDEYDPFAYRRPGAPEGKPGTCPEILETQNQLRKDGKQGFTGSNAIPVECEHSIRGGAYNYNAPGMRSTNRVHHPGSWRIAVLGFRCAKDHTN